MKRHSFVTHLPSHRWAAPSSMNLRSPVSTISVMRPQGRRQLSVVEISCRRLKQKSFKVPISTSSQSANATNEPEEDPAQEYVWFPGG